MIKVYFLVDVLLFHMDTIEKMVKHMDEEEFRTKAEADAFMLAMDISSGDISLRGYRCTFAAYSIEELYGLVEIEYCELGC